VSIRRANSRLSTVDSGLPWWRHAVFYEIYVRSFQDSDADGIGDLPGLIQRLDYLNDGTPNSLGVDALWLPWPPEPSRRSAEAQRADKGSILHLYRDLLALRRATPALERGSFAWLEGDPDVLAWERREGSSRAFVALNLGDAPAEARLPDARIRGGIRRMQVQPLQFEPGFAIRGFEL